MTEYWVSNAKHWCDVCKCWMNDTPSSRAHHEKGSGHKINVQRKLREMRQKAEQEKKEEARNQAELDRIEKAADRAYQKDVAKLDDEAAPLPPPAQPPPQFGAWERTDASPYWHNKALQWYYDDKTSFYYGGDPPEWTQNPSIPDGARFDKLHSAGKGENKTIIKGKLPDQLANLGGHRVPITAAAARSGAASTSASAGGSVPSSDAARAGKRARDADGKAQAKPISAAEEAERQQREAARKRVQARTASAFGLG